MFEANARLIAAAPDLLAKVRRLTAEADAMRRERDELAARTRELTLYAAGVEAERDELAARLAEMDRELGVHRLYARALRRAVDAATDFAGTVGGGSSWWEEVWAYHAAEMDRTRPAPAAAPERAEPDHCEDARGMVCATRGALLGGRAVCGDIHPGSSACCSTDRCVHQRPHPCRCGPDKCPDSVACPKGGAA